VNPGEITGCKQQIDLLGFEANGRRVSSLLLIFSIKEIWRFIVEQLSWLRDDSWQVIREVGGSILGELTPAYPALVCSGSVEYLVLLPINCEQFFTAVLCVADDLL